MKLHGCLFSVALLAACGGEDVLVFDAVPGAGGASGNLTSSVGGSSDGSSSETMTASVTSSPSSSSSSSSTTGMATEPCSDAYDCGNYFFCQKDSCSSAMGACQPRPVFSDPDPDPVCGCDGVTYWNDELRRQFGVASSTPGECTGNVRRCESGSDCGVFPSYCARILPPGQTCDPEPYPRPEGTCWVVPPRPEMVNDNNLFLLCPGPGIPPPEYCADTHLAIAFELPHIRINDVSECPNGQTVKDQQQNQ